MVKFLIHRPIAVLMSYLALVVFGIIAAQQLPVSLLPEINIPEVTVHVTHPEYSAREMENYVVRGLRWQFRQCAGIDQVNSETRDGYAILRLKFNFGTNTDLAAIEVNEKIDRAMGNMQEVSRPRVIKASATDIPIMYLNIHMKPENQRYSFLDLSNFTHNVIRKRIEQLEEVALVDITGLDKPEILLEPKAYKLRALGVDQQVLDNIFRINNIQLGNITVKDGIYQYNIRFSSRMKSAEDLANVYINVGSRVIQMKDIATITTRATQKQGIFTVNNERGISLAIIKQADAKMQDLKNELNKIGTAFTSDYPDLEFSYAQDQSALLDYSIKNLKTTLIIGGILAFMVVFLFMSNFRLPVLIGLSIPVSVIISLLFFMLLGISINIISLSGLILGIGLMIDNSIIVIDNISQFRERGCSLAEACTRGTNEVIRPLLSSAMTTSAVFIPLIFISGLAGALFYDQAITVSVGLGVSYLVSITFLPVLYHLLFIKTRPQEKLQQNKPSIVEKIYNYGFDLIFRYKYASSLIFLSVMASAYFIFLKIDKESFPPYPQKDAILKIAWNENITSETNAYRIQALMEKKADLLQQVNIYAGPQDFLLNPDMNISSSESSIYLEAANAEALLQVSQTVSSMLKRKYPLAKFRFESPENLFEKTFSSKEPNFVVKLHRNEREADYQQVEKYFSLVSVSVGHPVKNKLSFEQYIAFRPDFEKIMLYQLSIQQVYSTLRTIFNENNIGTIKSSNEVVPVKLSSGENNFMQKLKEATIINKEGAEIALMEVVEMDDARDFKQIMADIENEYVPIEFELNSRQAEEVEAKVNELLQKNADIDYSFSGSIFQFRKYLKELLIILGISLLLLYFILAAQFESMLQPLIILLEIPIDIAGALFLLWIFDSSLNVMSAIGIIVMTGIIINDSILKIDTINRLRRYEGLSILKAIHEGGKRRLRPIIMTSLTTILAVIPIMFGADLGSSLQKPLALAVAGGLGIGTLVSLFFIPLSYWFIYRKSEKKELIPA